MISLVFLAGCTAGEGENKFAAWRETYLAAENHSISADVSCSSNDKVSTYSIDYTSSPEGENVAVTAPELIAGVSAHIDAGDNKQLIYDGVVLETGTKSAGGLSPMTALPAFADFIADGHIEYTGTDTEEDISMLTTELELPDSSRMTLWQEEETMEPVHALIRSGESADITIYFTKIQ